MFASVVVVVLGSVSAAAVEFLPCQRALSGDVFTAPDGTLHVLESDQIVARGKLEAHWETGMEDQTGWCIFDQDTYEHLSSNGYDALHSLSHARVWLLDERGDVLARGCHEEELERGEVNVFGRIVPVWPNRPRLRTKPGGPLVMPNAEYARLFESAGPAVAIVRPHPAVLRRLDESLAPKFAAAARLRDDPARLIDVGSGRFHERQIFETVFGGRPEVRDDGRVRLHVANEPMRLLPHDRLYLIADDGTALGRVDIENFPAQINGTEAARVRDAARVVLVRKGEDRWFAETEF